MWASAKPARASSVIVCSALTHQNEAGPEARGAHLRFLPGYSRGLLPIDWALANLTAHLRSAEARTDNTRHARPS